MATAEESTRSIGRAKAAIDNGFSRVGRTLTGHDKVSGWLQAAAGRSIALADAVILLCREHHAAESASPARAVIQLAADMRWIAAAPSEDRLAVLDKDAGARDWGALWAQSALQSRLEQAGFSAEERREWLEASGRLCAGHLAGGASGLPWHHAFPDNRPRVSVEEALAVTAKAMREIVRALDARWPGSFALEEVKG